MVDLLKTENLKKMFRERYLERHHQFLNSISDITGTIYSKGNINEDLWIKMCKNIILKLSQSGTFDESKIDDEKGSLYFRCLRNSWYHECALLNPDDINIRMSFPVWKIIQSYYTIFSGIAALVRCFATRKENQGQNFILNFYGNQFLVNKKRSKFFIPPLSFVLTQDGKFSDDYKKRINWEYGVKHHLPFVKKCLEFTREKNKITTVAHYMKKLRDWATYEDSYLFFRMFGETIRQDLDRYLRIISFAHCIQTEFFLIKLFGFDVIKLQYDRFSDEIKKNIKIEPLSLNGRFEMYEKILS